MKRLSKMAYELRDVTIFYEKHVNQYSTKVIAETHNRSIGRICQILRIQMVRCKYYLSNMEKSLRQLEMIEFMKKPYYTMFYYYEIYCILQRYYIKLNGPRGYQNKSVIIDEVDNLPDNIEDMNEN